MYSSAMIVAGFFVFVSFRCLVFMAGRLPLSVLAVYVRLRRKANCGQFLMKKSNVYAGTRAYASFVRAECRGQSARLTGSNFGSMLTSC
jgi:hypothetical protein